MPIIERAGKRVRLGYCTNVHAGEDLETIEANLDRYAARVRERLSPVPERMGVGLWLAAPVAERLAREIDLCRRFRAFLEERSLFVFTLNAFPYGGFHREVVKRAVYEPDWSDQRRFDYTVNAALALIHLLPDEESEGTISTLPLGWRESFLHADAEKRDRAHLFVTSLGLALSKLEGALGKRIRVLLEPEPGCLIERTEEAIQLFRRLRREQAAIATEAQVMRHLGVCFDCCHQAVMGEDLRESLRELRRAGVPVGKVHASSAVEGSVAALAPFAEKRYLHQTVAVDGRLRADDIADLVSEGTHGARRVRCHVHVPISAERFEGGVATTRPALEAGLAEVLSWDAPPDIEVETYTWSVLPREVRGEGADDLVAGLADEMRWAVGRVEAGLQRGAS